MNFFLNFRYKSWKRRWFILNDNCLYYFEYTTDKEPRGIIPLENISVIFLFFNIDKFMDNLCFFFQVREIQDRNKPHCFELYACGGADIIKACKTDSEGKVSVCFLSLCLSRCICIVETKFSILSFTMILLHLFSTTQ